jgi:hypothetical protein
METEQEYKEEGHFSENAQPLEKSSEEKSLPPPSAETKEFLALLEASKEPEEKIVKSIEFMRSCLSPNHPPKFREFWEVRRACLPLFKEEVSQKSRSALWQQYVDLSVEARRLKTILDEQSAFAYEQIDLALQSLEKDLDSHEEKIAGMPSLDASQVGSFLAGKKEEYNRAQKELHFLSALAAKINALRKEVIKTDMRIRNKNKLFDKLSNCGNRIFPRRKELIKKISIDFSSDVSAFLDKHLPSGQEIPVSSLPFLREEIKVLQALAKQLTLSTKAFTETRLALSSAWDRLKEKDKERKKEILEKKALQKQSHEEALVKVKEFVEFCKEQTSLAPIEAKQVETIQFLKGLKDLGWAEFRQLSEEMRAARAPLDEKNRLEKQKQQDEEKAQEALRVQKIESLKQDLESLIQKAAELSSEELLAQKDALEEKNKTLAASKSEKMWIDRLFKTLKDRILEVKSMRLLTLSGSDLAKYEELCSLLQERKERRQEVKAQVETYRQLLGSSGFDFEKAMMYRELMESEKGQLDKMNLAIKELENQLEKMKG